MTERELRARLRHTPLPDESPGVERAWPVVRAAHADAASATAQRQPGRRRLPRLAGALGACALLLASLVLATASRPREALARWLRQAIGLSSVPSAHRTTLAGLPGGGRLLVQSGTTSWLVSPDGSRHLLGRYAGAELSPHQRYVLAWRGAALTALTPGGRPQWSLPAPATVSDARWSVDGFRIAYLAGGSLRVLAGDGSGDHDLVDFVAPVAPAWEPGTAVTHRLALLRDGGTIELRDADTGAVIWRRHTGDAPRQLLWSPDGRFLLAVAPRSLTLYGATGRRRARWAPPAGSRVRHATFAPGPSGRLALVLARVHPRADTVETTTATPAGLRAGPRLLLTLPERLVGLSVSPRGDWLLVSSAAADQWAAIRVRGPVALVTIDRVARRFAAPGATPSAFPSPVDWRPQPPRTP
jgi:hypothetical protein